MLNGVAFVLIDMFIRIDEYVRKGYSRFGKYIFRGEAGDEPDSGFGEVEVWCSG